MQLTKPHTDKRIRKPLNVVKKPLVNQNARKIFLSCENQSESRYDTFQQVKKYRMYIQALTARANQLATPSTRFKIVSYMNTNIKISVKK